MAVRTITKDNISTIAGSMLLVDIVHQQKLLSDDLYAQICSEYSNEVLSRTTELVSN